MENRLTIWITGLPGSGKTTISQRLEKELKTRGLLIERLDGEEVRHFLGNRLGFDREARNLHNFYLGYFCRILNRNGIIAVVAAISPFQETRKEIRQRVGDFFIEIYCKCPLAGLKVRDKRGLYRRAISGELKDLSCISDVYEEPLNPELVLETDRETPEESLTKICHYLEKNWHFPARKPGASGYSEKEEQIIEERLKNFGYL
jgi:adenylylsulfate kinase